MVFCLFQSEKFSRISQSRQKGYSTGKRQSIRFVIVVGVDIAETKLNTLFKRARTDIWSEEIKKSPKKINLKFEI